ncbi:hypothetical protein [Iningainema tapete]|uniref:Uncharacterized protein n=1 Tax=Iningainema tapete BLCC-T55 TaxID=2748662 RepID=A0A8J6XD61_9CYAN|nr:hypothetical protein [Iningainema tapete]MBD2772989.1 hypothetical protein [Iningainema tapete BLCC-T55]
MLSFPHSAWERRVRGSASTNNCGGGAAKMAFPAGGWERGGDRGGTLHVEAE